jgi:hypothetical protein
MGSERESKPCWWFNSNARRPDQNVANGGHRAFPARRRFGTGRALVFAEIAGANGLATCPPTIRELAVVGHGFGPAGKRLGSRSPCVIVV